MRFKEFNPKRTDERMPAIGQALKTVGGAAIQATRNAAAMGAKAVQGAAKGVKTVANTAGAVAQQQMGQTQNTTQQTTQPQMDIPAIGSKIVLPDLDTKKPGSYTIKSMRGNDVELEPVVPSRQTNEPKLSVKVNKRDLQNTLKAVSPEAKDKRTL